MRRSTWISVVDADCRKGLIAAPDISVGQTGGLAFSVDHSDGRCQARVPYDRSLRMESGLHGPGQRTGLLGRAGECAVLDGLIGAIRRGESRSVVLRGEAGIGKTALLEYLATSASDLRVVRAVGVESEMELAYAGLHQLCGTILDRLEKLPAPQRHALEIVFGLSAGAAPDRFLVALAVLSLLSEVSEERPVAVCR